MPQERKHQSAAHRQAAYRTRLEQARASQLRERGLPALPAISTMAGTVRWNAMFRHVEQMLSTAQAEMADYYDDRSESWQESDRGAEHQERLAAVEALVEADRRGARRPDFSPLRASARALRKIGLTYARKEDPTSELTAKVGNFTSP